MGIIYKTTNLINNKIYVGQSKYDNDSYLGSGVIIQSALNKYGRKNFQKTILEHCDNKYLNTREIYWINKLKACDKHIGYNISPGGNCAMMNMDTRLKISNTLKGFTVSEITKNKISESLTGKYIGENAFRFGIKLSDEHREKFIAHALSTKGKTFEEVYGKERARQIKEKMSNGQKNSNSWNDPTKKEQHRKSISDAKKGKPLTDKQRKAISKGLIGRHVSEETKQKLSKSNQNKTQKHSIKLECINIKTEEIFIFNNVEQACRELSTTRYALLQNKLKGFIIKRI